MVTGFNLTDLETRRKRVKDALDALTAEEKTLSMPEQLRLAGLNESDLQDLYPANIDARQLGNRQPGAPKVDSGGQPTDANGNPIVPFGMTAEERRQQYIDAGLTPPDFSNYSMPAPTDEQAKQVTDWINQNAAAQDRRDFENNYFVVTGKKSGFQDIINELNADPDAFTQYLTKAGRVPEADKLLKGFGLTDDQVNSFWTQQEAARQPPQIPPEGREVDVQYGNGTKAKATIMPDFTVQMGGKVVAKYNPRTQQLEPFDTRLPDRTVIEAGLVIPEFKEGYTPNMDEFKSAYLKANGVEGQTVQAILLQYPNFFDQLGNDYSQMFGEQAVRQSGMAESLKVLSMVGLPTNVLSKKIDPSQPDISWRDFALDAMNAAIIASPIKAGGIAAVAKPSAAGLFGLVQADATYNAAIHWGDMSNAERALVLGFDALAALGVKFETIPAIQSALKSKTVQEAARKVLAASDEIGTLVKEATAGEAGMVRIPKGGPLGGQDKVGRQVQAYGPDPSKPYQMQSKSVKEAPPVVPEPARPQGVETPLPKAEVPVVEGGVPPKVLPEKPVATGTPEPPINPADAKKAELAKNLEKDRFPPKTETSGAGGTPPPEKPPTTTATPAAPQPGEAYSGANAEFDALQAVQMNPRQKLLRGIQESKPALAQTKAERHEALSKRVGQMASAQRANADNPNAVQMAKMALKGELPTADFAVPEHLKLSQAELESMLKEINASELRPFEKLNTDTALRKLADGRLPTQSETRALGKFFGPELATAIETQRRALAGVSTELAAFLNIPRTLQTIGDLSASLRQGVLLAAGSPVEFGKAFVNQLRAVFSETNYKAIHAGLDATIDALPDEAQIATDRLYRAHYSASGGVNKIEEAFMGRVLEKVPGLGSVVRGSERAYNTMLDSLRVLVYSKYAKTWEGTGKTAKDYLDLAGFINHATGRGDLKWFEEHGAGLNALFFSPRFIASRIEAPLDFFTSTPAVRKIVARNLLAFVGAGVGALTLMKLAGAEVETDPRSADFGKGKFGNTRIDFWGGYLPYARLVAQLLTEERKMTDTGNIVPVNRLDLVTQFARSKLAPFPGLITDFGVGKTLIGEKMESGNAADIAYQRLTPMFIQDMVDAIKAHGVSVGIFAGVVSGLGVGVQTYADQNWNTYKSQLGQPISIDPNPWGLKTKTFNTGDLYSKVGADIGNVTYAELKDKKGIPDYVKDISAMRDFLKKTIDSMRNSSLKSLNADPAKGNTYKQVYEAWQVRQKLVDAGDQQAVDTYDAEMKARGITLAQLRDGNMTLREFTELQTYNSLSEAGKKVYEKTHPWITQNPRVEYWKSHPDDNAQAALYGQANIYSDAAYDKLVELAKKYDYPDAALEKLTGIPSDTDTRKAWFDLQTAKEKYGGLSSPEAKLLLLDNQKLREFISHDPIKDVKPSLELQVKNRALSDERDALTTDKAKAEWDAKHPQYQDDLRRIEAYQSTFKYDGSEASKQTVDQWAEYSKLPGDLEKQLYRLEHADFDKWGQTAKPARDWKPLDVKSVDGLKLKIANQKLAPDSPERKMNNSRIEAFDKGASKAEADQWAEYEAKPTDAERKLFLVENPKLYDFYVNKMGKKEFAVLGGIDALKLQVKNQATDGIYNNLPNASLKQSFLRTHPQYAEDRLRLEGYRTGVPKGAIEDYVVYNSLPTEGQARERYLKDNRDYYRNVYLNILGKPVVDFDKVASARFEQAYKTYTKMPTQRERDIFRNDNEWFDMEGITLGKWAKRAAYVPRNTTWSTLQEAKAKVAAGVR